MSVFIDVHLVQSVPPSCINRDETGTPKSAIFGGVRRLRVSSQAWKRATRLHFNAHLDNSNLGIRTKRVVELVAEAALKKAPDVGEVVDDAVKKVFGAAKISLKEPATRKDGESSGHDEAKYLLFLSTSQIEQLADHAIDIARGGALDAKAVRGIFKSENSIDIALFGRMVADNSDLNVDASCQVAHALSTHAAEPDFDYFTAVDDVKAGSEDEIDAGAGMIGTVEFSSATLYRYATINFDMLIENLGDVEAAQRAVHAFVDGFTRAMPTGKQNTFANRTLPSAVVVMVREDQPVSLVGAFERPIGASEHTGFEVASVKNLVAYAQEVETAYGMSPVVTLAAGVGVAGEPLRELVGELSSFKGLLERLGNELQERNWKASDQ